MPVVKWVYLHHNYPQPKGMEYRKNPQLEDIVPDWRGNPFYQGQYRYLSEEFKPSWTTLMRWFTSTNPQKVEKKADKWRAPILENTDYLADRERDFIVWLGHATFLFQLGGVRFITDPVLDDLPLTKRLAPLPFPIDSLTGIDYILLSHDHRDHCDRSSIKKLLRNNRPKKFLLPLSLNKLISSWTGDIPLETAAWYQRFNTDGGEPEIIFLPARHWCRRGLTDFNHHLWGSFLIRHRDLTIYFAADSALGWHFEEIGRLFPNIDLTMIGIGAYKPAYIMQDVHTSPQEAVDAFHQLGARRLWPMHYGTYDLSDEPLSEPYHHIQQLFDQHRERERLLLPAMNEPVYL